MTRPITLASALPQHGVTSDPDRRTTDLISSWTNSAGPAVEPPGDGIFACRGLLRPDQNPPQVRQPIVSQFIHISHQKGNPSCNQLRSHELKRTMDEITPNNTFSNFHGISWIGLLCSLPVAEHRISWTRYIHPWSVLTSHVQPFQMQMNVAHSAYSWEYELSLFTWLMSTIVTTYWIWGNHILCHLLSPFRVITNLPLIFPT